MQIRPQLKEGWITLLLLIAMMLVASIAIMETELISGLEIIPTAAILGLLVGVALAKSKFKDGTTYLFALIFGLFSIFYLIGLILPDQLIWRERVFNIIARQADWFQKAFSGGTSRDGLIFVIQTTAVYWLLGYTAAWYTFRYPRLWRAVIPTGLVLMSVVYYYNGPRPLLLYLAAFAVLTLLYAARTHLAAQEDEWRSTAVRYERGIWFDFLRAAFLVAIFILLLSWSLPAFSASTSVNDALSSAQGPWREFQDEWTRLFASLRAYGSGTTDPYEDSLILGGPRTVGSTLIMDVAVPRQLPNVYWQAIAYETYEDGIWRIAENLETRLHFPDDGALDLPATWARDVVPQKITNYLPNSSFLYAAPEVLDSDRQMFVESARDDQNKELVSTVRSRFVLRQGDQYEVSSRISIADAESLRNSSTFYPDWVTDRYLQLPDSITAETINLAEELAAPYDTAFDKSIAIRDYLRGAIAYNDQIDAPPDGVDPVHYTLFESKEGYCNYYASAMAVMLRTQGVPARVVSGYAQGEYDEASESYRVRANNAHTWVEVYFPQYGWIQFEPTAALPVDSRPETAGGGDAFATPLLPPQFSEEDRLPEDFDNPAGRGLEDLLGGEDTNQGPSFWERFSLWQMVGAIIIIGLAALTLYVANTLNRRVESDVDRSYQRLGSWARWLGIFYRPTDTPYERADMMSTAVPDGRTPIRNLTHEYVRKRFSPQHQSNAEFDSLAEWQMLRPLLIRQTFAQRLQRWRKRFLRQE